MRIDENGKSWRHRNYECMNALQSVNMCQKKNSLYKLLFFQTSKNILYKTYQLNKIWKQFNHVWSITFFQICLDVSTAPLQRFKAEIWTSYRRGRSQSWDPASFWCVGKRCLRISSWCRSYGDTYIINTNTPVTTNKSSWKRGVKKVLKSNKLVSWTQNLEDVPGCWECRGHQWVSTLVWT